METIAQWWGVVFDYYSLVVSATAPEAALELPVLCSDRLHQSVTAPRESSVYFYEVASSLHIQLHLLV